MDTLVQDGDFKTDVSGYTEEIYSIDEACQRVKFILLTQKGDFIFDRELGSDFSGLIRSSDISREAELRCREALADQKEISVGTVTAESNSVFIKLFVEVFYGEESRILEVILNGDVF